MTISLKKKQKVFIKKTADATLAKITMGIG